MKEVNKINACKEQIAAKKAHLAQNYQWVKQRFMPSRISLSTLGWLTIGFLFLPKKFKILKGIFKTYTFAATIKQMVDTIPHPPSASPLKKAPDSTFKKDKESKIYSVK
jgi:hypothetical protein